MKFQVNEKTEIKGEYTAISLMGFVKKTDPIVQDIREALRLGNIAVLNSLEAAGIIQHVKLVHNIIPTSGRAVLARILAGDTTYTGEINYGALGSAATPAFTNASTQLTTEVYRQIVSSSSFDDNICYVDWFIEEADVANQTFQEWGAFIDGTASADSGQAWSLLKTGGWVKSGSIFISAKYTIV